MRQFASLADKGDLLGYPGTPVVPHASASTWHRADISELHAVRSIVTGNMAVTAPDGSSVRLRYQRHIEHPNGNWTWVGRNAEGEEAIVTFGEKAVFGSIPSGHNELRLTTRAGRSWAVLVDPRSERHPEPKEPDYMVPPELAALGADNPVAAAGQVQAAAAAATTTVDVVLGYTTAIANELGGDSQAVTRLQHLVDVANQAYANSQIDAQIRLVRAMSVNYVDATDNNDALSKLTGYKSGTGNIPVDPAFNALRAAREQYGADLVSLVRRFRTPEQGGCGLAWLLGANQSSIDNGDAPFGYSVVSDDLDHGDINESDGQNYACRKESLAHELGHNMGQNHNVEDAGGDAGAHSYSYGYRESSTTGFYTVMAYRLANSNQRGVRYFANPNVLEAQSGRPTGVASSADNARSLAQTMPLIANFRATVVAPPPPASAATSFLPRSADINGDGRSDLLWTNSGTLCIWYLNGASQIGTSCPASAGPGYEIVAIGDFNGDHRDDLVWSNGSNVQGWLNNGSGGFSVVPSLATVSGGWAPVNAADMNGDGRADLLWSNQGTLCVWYMNGLSMQSMACPGTAGAGYRIVTIGDFNADGFDDLVWSNGSKLQAWLNNKSGGFAINADFQVLSSDGWEPKAAVDVDGDGRDDILWSHQGTLCVWYMDGLTKRSVACPGSAGAGYVIAGVGYYDANPVGDIVWTNGSQITTWLNSWSGFFWVYPDHNNYQGWTPH